MINSVFKFVQGIVNLRGATDDTRIGNVEDRLKTESKLTSGVSNPLFDGYDRQRVSQPEVIYDARFIYDLRPLLTTSFTTSGGTITRDANTSSAQMNVTTTNGSRSTYQSKEYIHYIPGQTFESYITGRFSANSANRKQRLGSFDNSNGVFFEYEDGDIYAVRRTSTSGSVVDSRTISSSWNIDKMDGTGPSGLTLDPDSQQNYFIRYQWNGSGPIIWGLRINGIVIYVHKEQFSNTEQTPWASTGDFPVRSEVINTATAANSATLNIQCFSVLSNGAVFKAIQSHAIGRSNDAAINDSVFRPLISIRLKAAYNRGQILLLEPHVFANGIDNLECQVVLNGTLTGASWVDVPGNSIAQYSQTATAISGGDVLFNFYVRGDSSSDTSKVEDLLKVASDYAGVSDTLTLTAKSLDNNADARGSLVFDEVF